MAFFSENGEEKAVPVNWERYHSMLTDFFIRLVKDVDQADIHFQQDGVTCHTTRANMSHLLDNFLGRLNAWFGEFEWPVRTPDLSPLDFFLWGHLKERVYRDSPKTLTELKEAVGNEITCIGSEVTKTVFDSTKKIAQDCIESGCHHLKNFVFNK